MNKNVILTGISAVFLLFYILVDFFIQSKDMEPDRKIEFRLKSIDVPDLKKYMEIQGGNDTVLGEFELWRYRKPVVKKEEKKKKERKYIIYKLVKIGNREAIANPENRNDIWEFYGVFFVGKKRFAIFYNKNLKEHKYRFVTKGDRLTEDLIIDKITSKKIYVKFPVSKKEYKKLELKVFYVDIEKFKKKLKEEMKNEK